MNDVLVSKIICSWRERNAESTWTYKGLVYLGLEIIDVDEMIDVGEIHLTR